MSSILKYSEMEMEKTTSETHTPSQEQEHSVPTVLETQEVQTLVDVPMQRLSTTTTKHSMTTEVASIP